MEQDGRADYGNSDVDQLIAHQEGNYDLAGMPEEVPKALPLLSSLPPYSFSLHPAEGKERRFGSREKPREHQQADENNDPD